jgi:hypothetical protein
MLLSPRTTLAEGCPVGRGFFLGIGDIFLTGGVTTAYG